MPVAIQRPSVPAPLSHRGEDPRACCAPSPLVSPRCFSNGVFLSLLGCFDLLPGHSPLAKSIQKSPPPGVLTATVWDLQGKHASRTGTRGQETQDGASRASAAAAHSPAPRVSHHCTIYTSVEGKAGMPGPGEGSSMLCSLPLPGMRTL